MCPPRGGRSPLIGFTWHSGIQPEPARGLAEAGCIETGLITRQKIENRIDTKTLTKSKFASAKLSVIESGI